MADTISGPMSDEDADAIYEANEANPPMPSGGIVPSVGGPLDGMDAENAAVAADLASTVKRKQRSYKVTIEYNGKAVVFEASAPVSESRSANYDGYNIVHMPADIWAYRNTGSRRFGVQGKLVSRTPAEASTNAYYLNLIRRWMLPEFGDTGSTPPIVYLSGYRNGNLDRVPCILRSYNWTFPDDVDYIWTINEPMPVVGMLGIELEEAYSAEQINKGTWKLHQDSSPQTFEGGAVLPSQSSVLGLGGGPAYKWRGIATGLFGIPGLPSVGGILNKTIGPLWKVLTGGRSPGVLTPGGGIGGGVSGLIGSGLGSSFTSSPQITEQLSQIAPVNNNPLLGGLSGNTAPPASPNDFVPFDTTDSFKRGAELDSPSFTEV